MYVCLCKGVTSQTVAEAVAAGASTTKKVANACGAGSDCGRCRRTVQAIIKATEAEAAGLAPHTSAKRVRRLFR
ncbi:MAG: (2Fe-2S)-binding protein [Mycobacteriaceae bacterium]|nr:(2Fe-2S)-binding protein [Mycobacteriaceae bacterium]MBV9639223.1 (2Fe-2S)-binding protein [Mycobacteriaceae bacterium]